MHVGAGRRPDRIASAVRLALVTLGLLIARPVGAAPSAGEAAEPVVPASTGGDGSAQAADAAMFGTGELGEIPEIPPSPRRIRWFGRASLGFTYRWAFDESLVGGALEGELGAQSPRVAGGVRMRLEAGRMLAGLPYQIVTFGPFILWSVHERVRLGVGIDAGALLISRRTLPGRAMWTVLIGGQATGAVDLLRLGMGALYLGANLGVHALTAAPGPITVSTTVSLGYRP